MKRTVEHEQFFTRGDLAERCVRFASELLDLDRFDHIVEPSAGAGAFFHRLPEERRIGLDIEPLAPGIQEADFLSWEPPSFSGPILTIGNPPFGQRAALAFEFLERACRYSDAVAFILPRSFNKYTFQNRVHSRFHLAGSFDCEEFHSAQGRRLEVRTVFQVWERRSTERPKVELRSTHAHFDMCHRHLSRTAPDDLARIRDEYEFAIAQVGASFAPREPDTLTKGSHWFISPNVPGVRARFGKLDFGFLDGMNTAHKSLSKKDIVMAYEKVLVDERSP